MILHIQPKQSFCLTLKEKKPTLKLKLDFNYIGNVYEHYTGSYVITPKIYSQIMETKNKVMDDDVNIEQIYYSQTENESGGYTAQIGEI